MESFKAYCGIQHHLSILMLDFLGQQAFCEVQYISFLLKQGRPMYNFNYKQIQLMYLK